MTSRGASRVITYGYDTKIPGLAVMRVTCTGKLFTSIHVRSGLSILLYDESAMRIKRFVEKYLKDFDFLLNADNLTKDRSLWRCVRAHKSKEGL